MINFNSKSEAVTGLNKQHQYLNLNTQGQFISSGFNLRLSLLTEYQNMLFCFNKVSMINSYGVSADAHTHTNKKKT